MINILLASCLALLPLPPSQGDSVKIEARVVIVPSEGTLDWDCTLHNLPDVIEFELHHQVEPEALDGSTLEEISSVEAPGGAGLDPQRPISLRRWRLKCDEDSGLHRIRARGRIREDLAEVGSGAGRSFSSTPGSIGEEGVFLGGASAWLPVVEGSLFEFDLEISLPRDWRAVSQGVRSERKFQGDRSVERWTCS